MSMQTTELSEQAEAIANLKNLMSEHQRLEMDELGDGFLQPTGWVSSRVRSSYMLGFITESRPHWRSSSGDVSCRVSCMGLAWRSSFPEKDQFQVGSTS